MLLVAYDFHIGRVNYAHQTPLGVAKFHGSLGAQEFFETHFYRVGLESEPRDAAGILWWDRDVDNIVGSWRVEVDTLGNREYVNDYTGARTSNPPPVPVETVLQAAEHVEVQMRHVVQRVDEKKSLVTNEYLKSNADFKLEVLELRRQNDAATIITKNVRRKLAYMKLQQMRSDAEKVKKIKLFLFRAVPKFLQARRRFNGVLATKIQARWRGYRCRVYMHWEGGLYELWMYRAGKHLATILTRLWYVYKQHKMAKVAYFLLNAPKERSKWIPIIESAGAPVRVVGVFEEYLYPGTKNLFFYRNVSTGDAFLGKPQALEEKDKQDYAEAKEIRVYGYTRAQSKLAVKLQALWRGFHVRSYTMFVQRAIRISLTAEVQYFENPHLDKNILNYALYTHVVLRDYAKARLVYGEAMRRMAHRGPDVSFILYAYAVFTFVSHDQDVVDCTIMIERGRMAEELKAARQREQALIRSAFRGEEVPESLETAAPIRYGRVFDLADIGFYKHTAVTSKDREAWHNYAACRFLVYDDYYGSFDAFLTAFRYDPSDYRLYKNFYTMMAHYHGDDEEKINEIIKDRMRLQAQKMNNKAAQETASKNAFSTFVQAVSRVQVRITFVYFFYVLLTRNFLLHENYRGGIVVGNFTKT